MSLLSVRNFLHNMMYTGSSTSAPGDGSRTLTITNLSREENDDEKRDNTEGSQIIGTLSLRGVQRRTGPRVAWDEDVIDNEGIGKKKSKICCIYHKPRRFDESSDESSSDDDSDDDSISSCPHEHDHPGHNHNHRPNSSRRGSNSSNPQQAQRGPGIVHEPELLLDDTEPNAYEKQPELKKGKMRAT
ncbi:hypothetical protein BYT27DRAFT_6813869 [Phlegmacium glaucopus]|nr:hypothetical protein BYT27DRAFT_6813869 [Phlegmacium glaucopus]